MPQDASPHCFVCGAIADGKLFPKCCKCSMIVCRNHRDKNGFFTQTYSCFPCCRPVAMRIPWVERVAALDVEAEARRRVAGFLNATSNGVGTDGTAVVDDAAEDLPVRVQPAPATAPKATAKAASSRRSPADLLASTKTRSAASKGDSSSRGLPQDELLQWQRSVAAPSPTTSPGCMRDPAAATVGTKAQPLSGTVQSKCSEAQSTKVEEWMDADQVEGMPHDESEEENEFMPVRMISSSHAVDPSAAALVTVDAQYLPVRRSAFADASSYYDCGDDGEGGELPVRYESVKQTVVTPQSSSPRRQFAFAQRR